jgi:hypothetical protein
MKNLKELARKFGTVNFEGKEYTLTCNPDFEYRSHNAHGWQMQHPDNYLSAIAISEGKKYKVWWFVDDTNVELDSIDYDNVADVEEV